jgi:hypothetical protein
MNEHPIEDLRSQDMPQKLLGGILNRIKVGEIHLNKSRRTPCVHFDLG